MSDADQDSLQEELTLGKLIMLVEQAARGDLALGTRLARLTEMLRDDDSSPGELRLLAQALRRILAGERNPDLSQQPAQFAEVLQAMLQNLLESERSGAASLADLAQSESESITLEELLRLVEQAIQGDRQLGEQLFDAMQSLASNPQMAGELRALGKAVAAILAGERAPDLSDLAPDMAEMVHDLLRRL
jgi:hypothetical protein